MPAINGTVKWGQIPLWFIEDPIVGALDYEMQNQQYNFNSNYMVSANLPMIYQVIWTYTGIDEQSVPEASGDVINCIFHVLGTTEYPLPAAYSDWDTLAIVRKTRDIPNSNVVNSNIPQNQRFTLDVSKIVQDELSYTLAPIGKGSFQNQEFGGMNGGETKQDNITETISPYNVTRNGAYRAIKVHCTFEQFDATGKIITSTTVLDALNNVRAINSVPDFKKNVYYNQTHILNQSSPSTTSPSLPLTNCTNYSVNVSTSYSPSFFKKLVRSTDQAEWLYYYVSQSYPSGYAGNTERFNVYEVYGQAYNKDGSTGLSFVLGSDWTPSNGAASRVCSDLSHSFAIEPLDPTWFQSNQNQIAVQNVSPAYINSHSYVPVLHNYPPTGSAYATPISPITSDTDHYRVYVRGVWYEDSSTTWLEKRLSAVSWFEIDDQEQKSVYDHVKFHWLNCVGGIDSYTATRNVMESLNVEKSFITTKLPARNYYQGSKIYDGSSVANGDYINDTMRGWDTYKGGQEVLNVNARVSNQVYTEPLNKQKATWLRDMFSSPNVWIETPTDGSSHDAAYHENSMNPYLRPVATQYTPVILTNSEVISLDQEQGLVKFNIEYTLAQGLLTQRN
tara:strand:- start:328 stop:2178 length:1851 start_codon:yes stop_codon:yes gene_type:complete